MENLRDLLLLEEGNLYEEKIVFVEFNLLSRDDYIFERLFFR